VESNTAQLVRRVQYPAPVDLLIESRHDVVSDGVCLAIDQALT
jgi:hypothetical protein